MHPVVVSSLQTAQLVIQGAQTRLLINVPDGQLA